MDSRQINKTQLIYRLYVYKKLFCVSILQGRVSQKQSETCLGKKKSIFLAKNFEELFLSIFIVHGEKVCSNSRQGHFHTLETAAGWVKADFSSTLKGRLLFLPPCCRNRGDANYNPLGISHILLVQGTFAFQKNQHGETDWKEWSFLKWKFTYWGVLVIASFISAKGY